jgi:predicted metal-binding membrane protein
MQPIRHDRVFLPVLLSIIGLSWLALVVWGQSPYARFLHHDGLAEIGVGRDLALLAVYVAGWLVMTTAMMLPTSLPLIGLFQRMMPLRSDGGRLVGLLVGGYLVVWTSVGVVAYLLDLGLHQLVGWLPWLERHEWLIGATVLLVAGLYQFTPLKHHCLDACRSPRGFIMSHWRGGAARRQAFRLGVAHGMFCVGCCWTLMLVLFLVGMGNLVWMLLLGGVMAVEKNTAWGRSLSRPLGVSLLSAGGAVSLLAAI